MRNQAEDRSRIRNCSTTKRATGNLRIAADAQLCQPERSVLCNFNRSIYTSDCKTAPFRAPMQQFIPRKPLERAHADQDATRFR
jgi:hypothetical protein